MEQEMVLRLTLGLIVIGIVVAFAARSTGIIFSGKGGESGGAGATATWPQMTPDLALDMTEGSVQIEAIRGDNFYYKITASPNMRVNGQDETNVVVMVEFKGTTVKGKFLIGSDYSDTEKVVPRDVFQPRIEAEMYSDIPPIQEFSANPFHKNVPVFIKSAAGAPLLIMLDSMEKRRDLSSNSILNKVEERCYIRFELKCEGSTAYTRGLTACVEGENYKCEQTISMCGGSADIKVLDEPDCAERKADADIRYDGKKPSDIGEAVWVSFWRADVDKNDIDCTKTADIMMLTGSKCIKYYVGRYKIETGLLTVN